jgi:hypothetical protein
MDGSIVAAEPITEGTGTSDGDDRAAGSPATERMMETFDYLDEEVEGLKQKLIDLDAQVRRRNEDLARLERAERTLEEKVRGTSFEVKERFDVELAGLSDRAETLMEVLEANSKKSGEIVETISGEANRRAFHVEAEAQRKQADRWRWTSIVLSTCAVALLVALSWGTPAPLRVADTLQHVALSIIVLGIGGYAASQSAQHRRREESARRLELDIETLDPLTNGLPEEDRLKIRSQVVERIFTRQETPSSAPADTSPTPDDLSLLARVFDLSLLARLFAALSPNPNQPPNK